MLKVATLFSGIGSVEHAIQRMGIDHKIVFAADIDKFARETYLANFNIDENVFFEDVCNIDGKKFRGEIDLLVGGSPCQSFSMVGKRKGLNDDRGNLIYQFIRIVDETQPSVFIFENVKGLLSHDEGKTFEKIKKAFDSLGYHYKYEILNAKDYGIPQHRERLFLIGFKNINSFNNFDFPKKIDLDITLQDLLEDNPDSKYYLGEKGTAFVTKEKNIKKRYTQINGNIALCQKANQQFNWHGDFIHEGPKEVEEKYYLSEKVKDYVLSTGTKNFYSKPKTDLPIARPLLQSMHKMHRAGVDNYITKGDKIRKLTPRECLRLMGFSDDFKIVCSDTQTYRQAGNSIVSNIFFHLVPNLGVLDINSKKHIKDYKSLPISNTGSIKSYGVESHMV